MDSRYLAVISMHRTKLQLAGGVWLALARTDPHLLINSS